MMVVFCEADLEVDLGKKKTAVTKGAIDDRAIDDRAIDNGAIDDKLSL